MIVTTKTVFLSKDGKEFETEEECKAYEFFKNRPVCYVVYEGNFIVRIHKDKESAELFCNNQNNKHLYFVEEYKMF